MTAVVDYGVGNLFSLRCSLGAIGQDTAVTGDGGEILRADRIILPGVGAFGDAAEKLRETGLDAVLKEAAQRGIPILGICLGMQLLFEESSEYGRHRGLGLIEGTVEPLLGDIPAGLKVPQMGWNALDIVRQDCPLFRYTSPGEHFYFVHSYYGKNCAASLAASCEYGIPVTAAVWRDRVFGCQFHPEKSGQAGLRLLKAFCEVTP